MKKAPPAKSVAPDLEPLADPAHPTLWASLVFAIATMSLAYPGLTGQILFNPHNDQYTLGYAFRDFAAQSLRSGHGFPQWSPFLQGGLPFIAAMHGDIFYPTFLLRMIMPTATAMTWEFPIHLFLAGLFTYFFLRSWRMGFFPALLGGLAYMMSGSIAGYASPGHDGKLFVGSLMPLALVQLTRGVRDGRRWAWGALALTVGLAFLSPQPQAFQYMLLVCGAFTLYLAFSTNDGQARLAMAVAVRRLALAGGAVVVGLMIGAVQFLPALFEYKPWSPRAAGHDWATATSYSFPIEETINAYLPQFSGILANYWGQNNIHFHSDYDGVVVLMLTFAAFGAAAFHNSFRRFWIGVGIVSFLWALGGHTPLYHLILYVPETKYLRAPSIMIYVTAFSMAVLVAIGAERWLTRRLGARYAIGWGIAAAVFALFISVGGYQMLVKLAVGVIGTNFDPGVREQTLQYFQFDQRADANTSAAILGAWRSFVFVALAAGTMWAFATGRVAQRWAAWALVAVLVADLWSIERLYWLYMPPASVTFATDPAAEAIKADIASSGQPGRALLLPAGSGLDPMDPFFRKNALMGLGVRTVLGEQGNELDLYKRMMELDSNRVEFRPEFWRHENVRYVYTGADVPTTDQIAKQLGVGPFVKLAGPVRNANGSMVYAYRLPGDNPLAWVAGAAVSVPVEQVLPTVLNPRYDPARAALIDTGSAIKPGDMSRATPTGLTAHVTGYSPGHIVVDLSGPAPDGSVLVVSENFFPGWKATNGSAPLTTSRVNYNLIGVALTPGTKHVELSFEDPAYAPGRRVTWIALVLATLACAGGLFMDRRAASPAPA